MAGLSKVYDAGRSSGGTAPQHIACARHTNPIVPALQLLPACSTHVGADSEHPELCERCAPVVKEIGFVPPKVAEPVQA